MFQGGYVSSRGCTSLKNIPRREVWKKQLKASPVITADVKPIASMQAILGIGPFLSKPNPSESSGSCFLVSYSFE